ncbi:MAG: hypothetical protein BroJett018_08460 [Chloroflexota bacterium]|nr:DUF433 domain-containing protein [Chloroflexota bacterium]NOG62740.1 DUF433 domain-containing protein [Chloroflexota bacterium]GIK63052.1 MAG: hypothetical protein BroJett018_08460 [Chloroflexota bacterium]
MATNEEIYLNPRIVVSRTVCHGKPRIAGTRIMVYLILDLLAGGKSFDEIITNYYPDITTEDIRACLEYASQVVRDEDIIPVA